AWELCVMPRMIDAHLDLSWNALSWDRDLTWPLADIRAAETGMTDSPARGRAMVNLQELRRGRVDVCLGTLLARARSWSKDAVSDAVDPRGASRLDLDYKAQPTAHAIARGQLGYYQLLEAQGHGRLVRTRGDLTEHWSQAGKDAADAGQGGAALGIIIA